ncbi:MAG: ABC transporter permease subunit [Candidatus Nitrohelix vancouverensis]|uniref:ABC transporter permease subunit n=1 Tax=Candidatus Nitrohelix vancouverensis TaxID=2705534 RepID=A0A7T0C581_9BACT|nr:MAG: ABC transporter permease subunit [Candidatus Nitrohelix vancouverensis]
MPSVSRPETLLRFIPPYFLVLILLLAGLPIQAKARGLESIQESGVLLWGADAEGGAPYVYADPKSPEELVGFEVELAGLIAEELGVEARHVQNDWDTLLPALKRGDFDIALNGIEWTQERERKVALTRSYYIFSQQLTVRRDEQDIQSFDDLAGKTVATLGGTTAHSMLEEAGNISVKIFSGQVEPYEELALGRVDATLLDFPIALYYGLPNERLKFAGSPFGEGSYVIGVRNEDVELLEELNEILERLSASGRLRILYEKWGLWNDAQISQGGMIQAARRQSEKVDPGNWGGYASLLLKGAGMTILLSTCAMTLAIFLGLALVFSRLIGGSLMRGLALAYIEVVRGTPLLLQLYMIYFGLPALGLNLNAFTAAILALGINYSAYEAEIYRAGIESIPRGQTEAALALGMPKTMIYSRILLPQALRVVLPPSTNDFIALLKDSSLVSIIAIVELTKTFNMLAVASMNYLELGVITATLYLMMSYPLSRLSRRLEKKFALE